MSTLNKLQKDLGKLLEEELGGFFSKIGDKEKAFFKEKGVRIAEEQFALKIAASPAEKRKHKMLQKSDEGVI